MRIDAETLRRWMLEEGLWSRERQRKPHRQRRQQFGELVQMDGSFHDWLEQRGPRECLMDMVEDATSRVELRLARSLCVGQPSDLLPKLGHDRCLCSLLSGYRCC